MKIIFTKHALEKFKHPSLIKLGVQKSHVKLALEAPDYSGEIKERKVKFSLKKLDDKHNLRVIYKDEDGIMIIVTIYPIERGRYEN